MTDPKEKTPFQKFISVSYRIEDMILVGFVVLMILLAVAQIVWRNIFGTGFSWGDTLVRILVLWIGLIGAMAAARKGEHITIDLVSRFLPAHIQKITNSVVYLFTSFVSGLIAWQGYRFVKMESQFGNTAFAEVPVWICETIIPIALAVISLRYLILTIQTILLPGKIKS